MSELFLSLMVYVRKISIISLMGSHLFVSEIFDFTCVSGFWWFSEFLNYPFSNVRNFKTPLVCFLSHYLPYTDYHQYLNVGRMSQYQLQIIQ